MTPEIGRGCWLLTGEQTARESRKVRRGINEGCIEPAHVCLPAPHSPIRCSVIRAVRARAVLEQVDALPTAEVRRPFVTGIESWVAVSAARMCAGMSSGPSWVWV